MLVTITMTPFTPLSTKREEKQQHEAIEFHNGDCRVPIFARGKNVMSPLETMKVLLNPDTEYICGQVPLRVQKTAKFIVDVGSLGSVGDVKCDDVGSWRNNSNVKFSMALYINENLDYNVIERTSTPAFQALWIEILVPNKKNIICGVLYRQHNSPESFLSYFNDTVERFNASNKPVYIAGGQRWRIDLDFRAPLSSGWTARISPRK